MAVHIVTGELGSGKSLFSVQRMQLALQEGRRVATNMDLFLEHLVGPNKPRDVQRLPDHPTTEDLRRIGKGHDGRKGNERRFGLIVLDEAATFLNSREWAGGADSSKEEKRAQALERTKLIQWLRHCRKFRWHLILITQDLESLDAQVRRALAEHVVDCRRLDRLTVPFISTLTKLLGLGGVTLPQVHVGVVYYKKLPKPVDKWWIPDAKWIREGYDTEQKILGENDGPATMLDHRHAPYMWAPRTPYDRLWRSLLWKFGFPPSQAQQRHDDFRLAQLHASSYKPAPVTFGQWSAVMEALGTARPNPVAPGGNASPLPSADLLELAAVAELPPVVPALDVFFPLGFDIRNHGEGVQSEHLRDPGASVVVRQAHAPVPVPHAALVHSE